MSKVQGVPAELASQVDRELRRAAFQVVERNRFNGHKGIVLGIAVSPDGQQIASSHQQSTILLWRVDGKLLHRLNGHQGEVGDVTFSPDGQTLVSAGQDGTVRFWSREGAPLQTINAHQKRVQSVVFSPDG